MRSDEPKFSPNFVQEQFQASQFQVANPLEVIFDIWQKYTAM